MSAPRPDATNSKVAARAVDSLRDRFESALRRGEAVRLETWLPADGPTRGAALIELAALELEHRLRAGEETCAEEYFARFPELRHEPAAGRLTAVEKRWRQDHLAPTLTVHAAAAEPIVSPSFGRYRLVKVLGQGGMGTVYHAHDTQLDRPVALKVIRFDRHAPDQVERFFREARIAAAFTHPHLCPVYDFARQGDVHFLTMPLLSGEPLSAHLRRETRLAVSEAVRLAARIARAVHEAHRAGVIHRDLKPANVMLNERREPVVMDFGLARRFGPLDPRTTSPGALVGTPAYMAPEQIDGGSDAGGPSQDVYSLGVLLYEMLTGALPFEGSLHQILKDILGRDPEPPLRRRPDLDPRLDRICLTAMAKDPKARFPSMEAFAEALEAWGQAPAPPIRSPLGRRRVGWLAGAATAVLVLLAMAGWWAWPRPVPSASSIPPAPPVPVALANRPPDDGFQAGDAWDGTSCWEGDTYLYAIHVKIAERSGDLFRGTYTVEDGSYIWRIEGTIHHGAVEWRFTETVHEKDPRPEIKSARVAGMVEGEKLHASYRDSDSTAILSLGSSK